MHEKQCPVTLHHFGSFLRSFYYTGIARRGVFLATGFEFDSHLHTCTLAHLSLFVVGLLNVSGGVGLQEIQAIFDLQFDSHIQAEKCEPFALLHTFSVKGSHSGYEVSCHVNVSKSVR